MQQFPSFNFKNLTIEAVSGIFKRINFLSLVLMNVGRKVWDLDPRLDFESVKGPRFAFSDCPVPRFSPAVTSRRYQAKCNASD